jgi:hypothetical protein
MNPPRASHAFRRRYARAERVPDSVNRLRRDGATSREAPCRAASAHVRPAGGRLTSSAPKARPRPPAEGRSRPPAEGRSRPPRRRPVHGPRPQAVHGHVHGHRSARAEDAAFTLVSLPRVPVERAVVPGDGTTAFCELGRVSAAPAVQAPFQFNVPRASTSGGRR